MHTHTAQYKWISFRVHIIKSECYFEIFTANCKNVSFAFWEFCVFGIINLKPGHMTCNRFHPQHNSLILRQRNPNEARFLRSSWSFLLKTQSNTQQIGLFYKCLQYNVIQMVSFVFFLQNQRCLLQIWERRKAFGRQPKPSHAGSVQRGQSCGSASNKTKKQSKCYIWSLVFFCDYNIVFLSQL